MASNREFVEYVAGQMKNAGDISYRAMFGEYAVYCNGKVIGLICDNRLYIKPTEAGRSFIGKVKEAPPYPGAKPCFLIESEVEDHRLMAQLVRLTEKSLPKPKKQKKKK